jgi:hypothetical protein
LRPHDELFCAKRIWNQASEQGYMRKLEGAFQALVERILGGMPGLRPEDEKLISHFYSLCRLRAEARLSPPPDISMKGVQAGKDLTKNEEEVLEKKGYIFARGPIMPSRHMASIRIQALMDRLCEPDTIWAVVYSRAIEFLVPDSFGEIGVVPLSPNYCLVANVECGEISAENAIEINRIAIGKSTKYYFARNLQKCGII